jgi:hypothetical protein
VVIDTKTLPTQGEATRYDEEGVAAFPYIPAWALLQEDLDSLMAAGVRAAPDIIYARRVQVEPTHDPDPFDRKECFLILFEISVCKDLGCQEKLAKKAKKYHPLIYALRRY